MNVRTIAKRQCDGCIVEHLRHSTLAELLVCIMLALAMNSLASSTVSAAESIEVTREVLLESGRFPIPYALAQTKEGGYVIAGSDQHIPWATRTDAQGNVQWRHVLPMKKWEPGDGEARYEGAATMADDSTMLCGFKNVGEKSKPEIVGMLTQIDTSGKVIGHRLLYPRGDEHFKLNYMHKCIRWGDIVIVIGESTRWLAPSYRDEHLSWLLAIDAKGNVKWERLLAGLDRQDALVVSNRELVLSHAYLGETRLTSINAAGEISSQRVIPGGGVLVYSSISEPVIRLVSGDSRTTLRTLGEHLEDVKELSGKAGMINSEVIYSLPDGSLVMFGRQREHSTDTAAIARLNANLDRGETFFFQPKWISASVRNALPTGKLGEFATIREISPIPLWPHEKRVGLVLAFIRFK
jgi:hypothetical protein